MRYRTVLVYMVGIGRGRTYKRSLGRRDLVRKQELKGKKPSLGVSVMEILQGLLAKLLTIMEHVVIAIKSMPYVPKGQGWQGASKLSLLTIRNTYLILDFPNWTSVEPSKGNGSHPSPCLKVEGHVEIKGAAPIRRSALQSSLSERMGDLVGPFGKSLRSPCREYKSCTETQMMDQPCTGKRGAPSPIMGSYAEPCNLHMHLPQEALL
ncbi:hypothetical protein VNO77_31309 [Canavalia gladiata]|uniref:Uncharacterized protein n=1 Tax=Canavalia gladiata TaxID=3824 RepID=A0AAN9KNW1_CANGL